MTTAPPPDRSAPRSETLPPFWRGLRDSAPMLLVMVPFGLLFGVAAKEAGLNLFEVFSMSALVIAGASQFTALHLMQDQAPTIVVIVVSLIVNARMALYSAAMTRHLGPTSLPKRALAAYLLVDQSFAISINKFEAEPAMSTRDKLSYYFGTCMVICLPWYGLTVLGAVIGEALPTSLSADFAVAICFITFVAPMIRSLPHMVAAIVAVVASLLLGWLPWSTGMLAAAFLGIFAGGQAEFWQRRKRASEEPKA